jgi:RNA polymerase sigma factor (sigma-70 family)
MALSPAGRTEMQASADTPAKVGSAEARPLAAGRQKWSLTQESFDGLLASLGPDRDTAAHRYLEVRRNLVRLFEWRGCATPDEYADETLNRCARKIGEGEEIRDLATYAVGVARMLLLEMARERAREPLPLEKAPQPYTLPEDPGENQEQRVECLRQCLATLAPEDRDFILQYYRGDKGDKINNRKELTIRLGIPPSTLRMRALRLREKLQNCAQNCIRRGAGSCHRFTNLDSRL